MKTAKITLNGKIGKYWDDWNKITICQPDGYIIDLISRFKEIELNSADNKIQVNYHISKKPLSLSDLKENLILKLSGALEADYQANGYSYSSWTSGTDYDCVLKVGSHDIYTELFSHLDKFVFFEIIYNIKN